MTSTLSAPGSAPLPLDDRTGPDRVARLRPQGLLIIVLLELATVIWLGLARRFGWFGVDRLPNQVLDVLPLSVPWTGALGGLTVALIGLSEHWRKWSTNPDDEGQTWNLWYIDRPIVGALMGSVGVLIIMLVLGAAATSTDGQTVTAASLIRDSDQGPAVLALFAFVVGYRQATFAELIGRTVDVILGPGDGGSKAAGQIIPLEQLEFTTVVGVPVERSLLVTNPGGTPISVGPGDVAVSNQAGTPADTFQVTAPGTIAAKASGIVRVVYGPTAATEHRAEMTLSGAVAQVIVLVGRAQEAPAKEWAPEHDPHDPI